MYFDFFYSDERLLPACLRRCCSAATDLNAAEFFLLAFQQQQLHLPTSKDFFLVWLKRGSQSVPSSGPGKTCLLFLFIIFCFFPSDYHHSFFGAHLHGSLITTIVNNVSDSIEILSSISWR